jgi:hypothetical protein
MMAGIKKVSHVDWCLTNKMTGSFSPRRKFSMPVMRFSMPKMKVPLLMAFRSQAAHHQYKRLLLMNKDAKTTTKAQGMTVIVIHSM